jgi:hypothetical protein
MEKVRWEVEIRTIVINSVHHLTFERLRVEADGMKHHTVMDMATQSTTT